MKNLAYKTLTLSIVATTFVACENNDMPFTEPIPFKDGAYVLNYGSGNNRSSLSYYDFEKNEMSNGIFSIYNEQDELGDGANHMCIYGAKMYVAVSGSGKIEVLNLNGKRLQKIELKDEENRPLKPRHIASHGNYVYFTSYGGHVQRIDTLSLSLDPQKVKVGDFPEAITVANNKLFVNNSKYQSLNVSDKGETVSVIDPVSFAKIRDIEVPVNPYNQAITAKDGNVYIVSAGDWGAIKSTVLKIDSRTYDVTQLGLGSVIASHEDKLYVYYSVWGGEEWLKTYDLTTGKFSEEEFIPASTFDYVNAMNVNPENGDLYISDSRSKMTGNLFIYDGAGNEKGNFEVGYSPNGTFFPQKTR